MNPYLERAAVWPDFHQTYLTFLRSALTERVGADYFVAIQEHVYVHESDDSRTLLGIPDVDVTFAAPSKKPRATKTTATLAPPATVSIPRLRKRKVPYLEVVDEANQKVVAVIELLSPSNKYAGEDRESYLAKRRELFATRVNFVELDFLRGGPRMPLKDLPQCDYYAMVSRPAARPKADVWSVRLRDPLPTIPIPLREGDDEVVVDLQAVLHRVYDSAGYERKIYRHDPEPKLAPTDAEWAKGLLAAAK
jgi:hypothetical protein